jgi:Xaa-Pro aminopeptidase
VALPETVEALREVKAEEEIELIRRAAAITDAAMEQVPTLARVGIDERELAWQLERRMREAGADEMAFPVKVAGGPNAARPHHSPGDRPLQVGDTIIVDMGAAVGGYRSDLTRSFHLGADPGQKFWEVYNLTLQAQKTALAEMRAGMSGREIDGLARSVIEAGGYGDDFGHSLGHGVGLEIHEGPRLGRTTDEAAPAGAVVTVEPGIYLPGWGGIRIEDLVLLTAEGAETISACPKTPIIHA